MSAFTESTEVVSEPETDVVSEPETEHRWKVAETAPEKHYELWSVNWPLLIISLILAFGVVSTAFYYYQRQVKRLPPQLLALANSAEEAGDVELLISRLHRYLSVRRDDLQTTRRLADLYYERTDTREEVRRAASLYSRCLTTEPETVPDYAELKLRYVTLLSLINPTAALLEIDRMLPEESDIDALLADEPTLVDALELRSQLREQQLSTLAKIDKDESRAKLIGDYELLAQADSDNAAYVQKLALLCRQHAEAIKATESGKSAQLAQRADRLMDEAVEQHPDDVDVLLRRFQYQIRYSRSRFPDTSDLQRILEIDQSNPRALMTLAFFLAEGRSEESLRDSKSSLRAARDFLQRSMDQLSDRSYALVALANIHLQLDEIQQAESTIRRAVREYPDSHIVHVAHTKLALLQERFDDASKAIAEIRRAAREVQKVVWSSPEQLNEARIQTLIADLLEAEWILRSQDPEVAKPKARELLRSIDFARLQSQNRVGTLEDIGRLFAEIEDWDYTIELLERARSTGIVSTKSEVQLAETYQRVGKRDRAIQVYRELSNARLPAKWQTTIWFRLGMLSLRQETSEIGMRRWDEVARCSTKLQNVAPASEEAFLLKMSLKLAQGLEDRDAVITELREAEADFGSSIRFWVLCTDIYRELEQFQFLQQSMDRLAEVSAGVDEKVTQAANRPILSSRMTERDREFIGEINTNWAESDFDGKVELVRRWCSEIPDSVSARLALANLGTVSNRPDIVEEAVQSLQGIEIGSGYFWRIAEVSQLLASFRTGNLADGVQAQRRAEALVRQYPGHLLVAQLAASCQETCGDIERASAHYLRAAKIEPTKWAIDGYLRTLILRRDWQAARSFLEQIPQQAKLTREAIDFVIHAWCESSDFQKAIEAIEQLVASQGSHSAHTHYLMAAVLHQSPNREDLLQAHRHLQSAVELSPSNLGYRVALFHFQINVLPALWTHETIDSAVRIRWLLQSHQSQFAPEWSALVLAYTLQWKGRWADADAYYRKAIKLNPQVAQWGWIPRPLLSKNATATDTPVSSEVAWLAGDEHARTLAAIKQLWDGEPQKGLTIAHDEARLNAVLAVIAGKEDEAVAIIHSIEPADRGPGDLMMLASLEQRRGEADAAHKAWAAAARKPETPFSLIEEILDHALANKDFQLASLCMEKRIADFQPGVANQVLQARIDIGLGQPGDDILAWIKQRGDDLPQNEQDEFLLQMANALTAEGLTEEAYKLLNETVGDRDALQDTKTLWLAERPQFHEEAIQRLNESNNPSPDLRAAVLYRITRQLRDDSNHRESLIEHGNRLLQDDVEMSRVSWLMLGAALERLHRYELALQACEAAMPTDDTISMVEHHLIWLRGGYLKTLDQPLAEIDKLIRAFGPRDDLMDTRSVFLLLQEESQQAKEITRLTSLLDPLTAAHRIHDRLADAQMAPIDERTTLLELDPTEQVEATELTLSILNRTLAEVR